MQINVAIIGSGKMALSYSKVLKANRNFNLIGAYSRNVDNLKSFCFENSIFPFKNIKNLTKYPTLDLIIVAVTAPNLLKIINKIFNVKCKVLIEKPLGISLKEANKIYKKILFKKNFFFALNRRFYGSVLLAKKKINKKKYIIYIEDHINFNNFQKLGFNNKNKKNFIYSHSIHLIDFLNIFSKGKPIKFYKKKIILNNKINIYCFIEYQSGNIGIYNAYYDSSLRWKVIVKDRQNNFLFMPLENLVLSNNKNFTKMYAFKLDHEYKPGIWNLIKEIEKMFEGKTHKLLLIKQALPIMSLINKIHF